MIRGRLPDIVKPGPNELPQGERSIPFRQNASFRRLRPPAGGAVPERRALLIVIGQNGLLEREMVHAPALHDRSRFTAVDDPVRMLGMMLAVVFFRIIVACDLDEIRAFSGIFPRHVIGADRHPGVLLRIGFAHFRHQQPGDFLPSFICMSIIDFIPDAPQQKAGVVAVPPDPALYVHSGPIFEKACVIVSGFWSFPHVKSFGHDQQPHLIRQIHQLRRRHIVGRPDRIDAHLPQNPQSPPQGFFVERRSQSAEIVVFANAVQFHVFPVQKETCVRIKADLPESDGLGNGFNNRAAGGAARSRRSRPQLGHERIQMRRFRAPKLRVRNRQLLQVQNDGGIVVSCPWRDLFRTGLNDLPFVQKRMSEHRIPIKL